LDRSLGMRGGFSTVKGVLSRVTKLWGEDEEGSPGSECGPGGESSIPPPRLRLRETFWAGLVLWGSSRRFREALLWRGAVAVGATGAGWGAIFRACEGRIGRGLFGEVTPARRCADESCLWMGGEGWAEYV